MVGPNFHSEETQAAIAAATPAAPEQDQSNHTEPPAHKAGAVESQGQEQQTPATETDKLDIDLQKAPEEKPVPAEKLAEVTEANISDAGFNKDDLLKKVSDNNGIVPDEVKAALAEKYTQDAIDSVVTNIEAQFKDVIAKNANTTDMNTYIFETLASGDAAKGQEHFKNLSEWCQANMDKADIASINTLLSSDNKDVVRKGLEQAVAAWKKGQEKPMMSGDSTVAPPKKVEIEPLSRDEYVKIVSTEKYMTDMEYRAKIDARRRQTLAAGETFFTPEFSRYRKPM